MKRPYGTKSEQVNLRLSKQAREMLEEMGQIGEFAGKTRVVEVALFELYHNYKEWTWCPACHQRSGFPMILPFDEPYENTCPHCGHVDHEAGRGNQPPIDLNSYEEDDL